MCDFRGLQLTSQGFIKYFLVTQIFMTELKKLQGFLMHATNLSGFTRLTHVPQKNQITGTEFCNCNQQNLTEQENNHFKLLVFLFLTSRLIALLAVAAGKPCCGLRRTCSAAAGQHPE